MSPILDALNYGFSAKQLLSFLSKMSPEMEQSIQTALAAGYTGDQILKFLSKQDGGFFKKQRTGESREYKPSAGNNLKIQAMREREEEFRESPEQQIARNAPGLLGQAALAAGGAYVLNRALPAGLKLGQSLIDQIAQRNPDSPDSPSSQDVPSVPTDQGLPPQGQEQPVDLSEPDQPQNPTDLSQIDISQPATPPQSPTPLRYDQQDGRPSFDFQRAVTELSQAGLSPAEITQQVEQFLGKKGKSSLERQAGTSIASLVNGYIRNTQSEKQTGGMDEPPATQKEADRSAIANDIDATIGQPNFKPQDIQKNIPKETQEQKEESKLSVSPSITKAQKPLKKGQYVFTTTGVYSPILDFDSRGRAIVEDSKGRRKAWSIDKLIEAPEKPDVDLDKITLTVKDQMPTKAKLDSSNIFGHAYFPDEETAVVRFNTGEVYAYYGVPQDVYESLVAANETCTTKGENAFGKWWVGKNPSLGATFHRKMKRKYPYDRLVF